MLNALTVKLESTNFMNYIEYINNGKKVIWRSFVMGLARGLGAAVGFSLLGAAAIYVLQLVSESNLPYIADFIGRIIEIIERKK